MIFTAINDIEIGPDRFKFAISRGEGTIASTTSIFGHPETPFRCKVRLYRDSDGLLCRETISAAGTGAYAFYFLDPAYTYTAIAYDHTGQQESVCASRLPAAVI